MTIIPQSSRKGILFFPNVVTLESDWTVTRKQLATLASLRNCFH